MRSRQLIGKLVDEMDLTASAEFNPWLAEPDAAFSWAALKSTIKALLFASTTAAVPPPDATRLREVVTNRVRARIRTGHRCLR